MKAQLYHDKNLASIRKPIKILLYKSNKYFEEEWINKLNIFVSNYCLIFYFIHVVKCFSHKIISHLCFRRSCFVAEFHDGSLQLAVIREWDSRGLCQTAFDRPL